MKLEYKIDSKQKLLIEVITGTFNFSQLKKLLTHISSDKQFSDFDKVLTNLTNAHFKISLFEIDSYLKFIKEIVKDKEVKWALLTSKPKATALAMLISFDSSFKKSTKIFSTLEGCTNFLEVSINENEFSKDDFISVDFS